MNAENIPVELRNLRQWVVWKTVVRDGQSTKLPHQVNGLLAKSNDPSTWSTFGDAKQDLSTGRWSGVGFVFSADDPYAGIDLDGCRNPDTGEISDWAKKIIVDTGSYAEVSPSKTGVKIWVRGKWNGHGHQFPIATEKVADKTPQIEIYDSLRYFAVTGQRLKGMNEIVDGQAVLDAIQHEHCKVAAIPQSDFRSDEAVYERARSYLEKVPPSISGSGGHNTAFNAACILVLGFELPLDAAYSLLCEWNQSCEPPWSEKELRHKIESANQQSGERGYLRNASSKNWGRIEVPAYSEPPPEPTVMTLAEAAAKYMETLKSGGANLIETGINDLDYSLGGGVEPSEMFIFAGRPSHGKSAVALQMVYDWTEKGMPTAFLSEEMSAIALGKRVVQYATEVPQEHWSHASDHVNRDLDAHFAHRAPCFVLEACRTAEAAANAIRKTVEKDGVKCVVVDYAQLLTSKGGSRYEQVTQTSIALKQVASETGVLMLALCQLNRSIESRERFIPKMSDLRDAGQLEQDADVVVFGVWPHRLDSSKDPFEYMFFVAKNRNRAINQTAVECRFEPTRQRFLDKPCEFRTEANVEDGNFDGF